MYVLDSDIDTPILDPDTIKDQNLRIMEDSSNVATAFMSLWEPRLHSTSDNGTVETTSSAGLFSGPRGEIFSTILRIISPKDILESYDAAVKGVCLVPTQMNKIYCQCDAGGRIQVDGTLIDGLEAVGLTTEIGSIRAKDITADEIMLMSKSFIDLIFK